ncbi:MAG: cytochrome c [Gammaproteobacteria bacterium]|nr:cytochrome c [Gammaproteobacteria bacterium]
MSGRAAVLLWLVIAASPVLADDVRQHGEYLFRAAGCATCHTDEKNHGVPLAGGRALKTSFGTFYTPNITPDPDTGIGRWSEADFIRALREGISPAGEHYYPAFPYTSYTRLTDTDQHAIWVYLSSRKPVQQANKPHELPWYLRSRASLGIWKKMFLSTGAFQSQPDRSAAWNRGAYLVNAVAHCCECHTPRNFLGGFKESRQFAGNSEGVEGTAVSNITPDKKTGIGKWSETDLVEYLETGATPDGDYAGDIMAEVIDNSLAQLTKEDRRAIAAYVMSLPPLENTIHKRTNKKPKPKKEEYE